jgi:hypothetical protein
MKLEEQNGGYRGWGNGRNREMTVKRHTLRRNKDFFPLLRSIAQHGGYGY